MSDAVSILRGGVGPGKIFIFRNPEMAFSEKEAKLVGVVCVFFPL